MSSVSGIDTPKPDVENSSTEGEGMTVNTPSADVEQAFADLALIQAQEAVPSETAAAGWGGDEDISLTDPAEAEKENVNPEPGTAQTDNNTDPATDANVANAMEFNVTHSGGNQEATHELRTHSADNQGHLESASHETAEPFDPDRDHLRRIHRDSHGPAANNTPNRFELFLLGPGEKKVTEEIDTRMPNTSIFTFNKEDHTLGNLLRAYLLKHPNVTFSAYKMPHPLVSSFELRVQTDGAVTPRQAVVQTCRELVSTLGQTSRVFTREMELYRIAHQEGAQAQGGSGAGRGPTGGEGPSRGAGGAGGA